MLHVTCLKLFLLSSKNWDTSRKNLQMADRLLVLQQVFAGRAEILSRQMRECGIRPLLLISAAV